MIDYERPLVYITVRGKYRHTLYSCPILARSDPAYIIEVREGSPPANARRVCPECGPFE